MEVVKVIAWAVLTLLAWGVFAWLLFGGASELDSQTVMEWIQSIDFMAVAQLTVLCLILIVLLLILFRGG